jgi:hypothetical protein
MFSSTQQLSGKIRALEAVPTSSSIRRSLRMISSPRSRVKMGASVASDKGGTSFLPFILSAATGARKRFRRGRREGGRCNDVRAMYYGSLLRTISAV